MNEMDDQQGPCCTFPVRTNYCVTLLPVEMIAITVFVWKASKRAQDAAPNVKHEHDRKFRCDVSIYSYNHSINLLRARKSNA